MCRSGLVVASEWRLAELLSEAGAAELRGFGGLGFKHFNPHPNTGGCVKPG